MSRHGYSSGYGLEAAAGNALALCIVIAVIVLYLFIRSCVFIGKTLYRYYKHSRALKISVAVCMALFLLSGALTLVFDSQGFETLAFVGYVQLLVVCAVVHRQNANTFMVQDVSIRDAILHRKWWADETTSMAA